MQVEVKKMQSSKDQFNFLKKRKTSWEWWFVCVVLEH